MLSWISTVGKRCKACWSSQLKNDVHYKPAFRKERFEAQMVLFFILLWVARIQTILIYLKAES